MKMKFLLKFVKVARNILNRLIKGVYCQDGLVSFHNHDFMDDPFFQRAYQRGIITDHDYEWHWRVHIGLWASYSASKLDGDFVECGVNWGFLSSAIMEYLNWDSLGKTFYLLDTFYGLDERYISDEEAKAGALKRSEKRLGTGFYVNSIEPVRINFSQWQNVCIIPGPIPETLHLVKTKKIAYLHLDMNCSVPEVAAFNFFWSRLVPGAFILLDDYAYRGCQSQKLAMDAAVEAKKLKIASLPTGQGLLIKPSS